MAKKHKHEEHVNHERWVISFADMMTLLFALFVVLYALGQADLSKMKQLKQSVQWAFHIAGEGKTKDTGIFEQQSGGGDVMQAAPLVTAQGGERVMVRGTSRSGRKVDTWVDSRDLKNFRAGWFSDSEEYRFAIPFASRDEAQAWADNMNRPFGAQPVREHAKNFGRPD